jgi:Cfr10I/Bse634I restriction endonuclease
MPFALDAHSQCPTCPHGYCVSYIREKSMKMKDRDTQYRLSQSTAMACCFDMWVPGGEHCPEPPETLLTTFIDQLIRNANSAGKTLELHSPKVFGKTERPFFLSAGQIGKVRGDVYEILCRAILWNSAAERNASSVGRKIAVLSLGDNYDLRKLFTAESGKKLVDYIDALRSRSISLSYSTPDLVGVDITNLPPRFHAPFSIGVPTLSIEHQQRISAARGGIEGHVRPDHIVFACGLKTSLRSDRMFQFLFEANAWKFIWRRIFELPPCPYYSITSRSFGANSQKLRSVEFSALGGASEALRAIDSMTEVGSAADIKTWFSKTIQSLEA